MNKNSTKFASLYRWSDPFETLKSHSFYNWLKIENFQPKIWQKLLFYQHSQPCYNVKQKEIENLEFYEGANV